MKALPSVKDEIKKIHIPSVLNRIFWDFGYIDAFDFPIARRNKINRSVEVRRYNKLFNYWGWVEVTDKYKPKFIKDKYWI